MTHYTTTLAIVTASLVLGACGACVDTTETTEVSRALYCHYEPIGVCDFDAKTWAVIEPCQWGDEDFDGKDEQHCTYLTHTEKDLFRGAYIVTQAECTGVEYVIEIPCTDIP